MYREQFGKRFLVKCEGFTTRLQANLDEDGALEDLSNVSLKSCYTVYVMVISGFVKKYSRMVGGLSNKNTGVRY